MTKQELKELSVADILQHELFKRNLGRRIESLRARNAKFKKLGLTHPVHRLIDKGVFDVDTMTKLYASTILKSLKGFSASEREAIKSICGYAYNDTYKELERLCDQE